MTFPLKIGHGWPEDEMPKVALFFAVTLGCDFIDLDRQSGDLTGGLVLMDHAFGCSLLNNGYCIKKAFPGSLCRIVCHSGSDFPDYFFDPGFISLVSYPFDFILPGPFKGGCVVCQIEPPEKN